ncbi:hypothetical protein J6590_075382 [Homalodisca vitripennis]|nr:hypothetical protein J6590_075382 [Homalodisca vitripennis]
MILYSHCDSDLQLHWLKTMLVTDSSQFAVSCMHRHRQLILYSNKTNNYPNLFNAFTVKPDMSRT